MGVCVQSNMLLGDQQNETCICSAKAPKEQDDGVSSVHLVGVRSAERCRKNNVIGPLLLIFHV